MGIHLLSLLGWDLQDARGNRLSMVPTHCSGEQVIIPVGWHRLTVALPPQHGSAGPVTAAGSLLMARMDPASPQTLLESRSCFMAMSLCRVGRRVRSHCCPMPGSTNSSCSPQGNSSSPQISHPCYPRGYQENITTAELYDSPCVQAPSTASPAESLTVTGTGDPAACSAAIEGLFNFSCGANQSCGFNGVYQPPVRGAFFVRMHPGAGLALGALGAPEPGHNPRKTALEVCTVPALQAGMCLMCWHMQGVTRVPGRLSPVLSQPPPAVRSSPRAPS